MFADLSFLFLLTTVTGPLNAALEATEAPNTARIAFTVEITSKDARRVFSFDPRLPQVERWQLIATEGDDATLDEVGLSWSQESAPDGRLFPDDLRASLGKTVSVEDMGAAWRVAFTHLPSENDGSLDVWAAENLKASAWIDPVTDRFMRIDYSLSRPVRGPEGGRVTRYDQTWYLEPDPSYGFSVITAFSVEFEARAVFQTIRRGYSARVTRAEVFFASPDAARSFKTTQKARIRADSP